MKAFKIQITEMTEYVEDDTITRTRTVLEQEIDVFGLIAVIKAINGIK